MKLSEQYFNQYITAEFLSDIVEKPEVKTYGKIISLETELKTLKLATPVKYEQTLKRINYIKTKLNSLKQKYNL